MFHNYFHIIPPAPGENEFSFSALNFQRLIRLLMAEPQHFTRYLFSYFGHYGVQMFVFVSGYGLYLSEKDKNTPYFSFLIKRIKKLYPSLLVVIVLLMIFISVWEGGFNAGKLKSLLLKLTLAFNFIPGEALSVSGPYWFFSLIVQLYAVFPFLLNLYRKYGSSALLVTGLAGLLMSILFNGYLLPLDLNLYYTFIGHMPVFCLGMYFASQKSINIPSWLFIAAVIVFALGNVDALAWNFSFLSITIIFPGLMILVFPVVTTLPRLRTFLVYTGSFSLYLFVVHGMTRFPFEAISERYDIPILTAVLSIIYIAASFLFAGIVQKIEEKLVRRRTYKTGNLTKN